jgi:hypothetical protein
LRGTAGHEKPPFAQATRRVANLDAAAHRVDRGAEFDQHGRYLRIPSFGGKAEVEQGFDGSSLVH